MRLVIVNKHGQIIPLSKAPLHIQQAYKKMKMAFFGCVAIGVCSLFNCFMQLKAFHNRSDKNYIMRHYQQNLKDRQYHYYQIKTQQRKGDKQWIKI